MPTSAVIEFENNSSKVFYGGQSVNGIVRLTITNEKIIKKAYISIVGEGRVRWTDRVARSRYDASRRRTVTEYHNVERSSSESYLNLTSNIIGENVRLMPGSYIYPFESVLPMNLPTSFNGKYGHITYKVRVVLDVKSNWFDKKFEEPFTVIKPINLNLDPRLREPVIDNDVNTFYPCCLLCCWESDPLEVTGRIPIGGYTPGQTIDLNLLIHNKSDTPVEGFYAQLIKTVTYYASGHQKSEENVVAETRTQGCDVFQNKNHHAQIVVPSIPPSETIDCKIIKIQYRLRVSGSVDGCHSAPSLMLPIIIGIFPILDMQEQQPGPSNGVNTQQPGFSSNPSAPPISIDQKNTAPLPVPSAPNLLPSDEPPNYEEAMQFGAASDKDFIPKYPMFKRQTSNSNH